MIKKFSTTYTKEDTINFIIDDDENMDWISTFDSNNFSRFFIVIDKEVDKLWGNLLRKKLETHDKESFFFKVEAIEQNKSLDFYPKLIDFLEKNKCNLADLVIAIGGGIIIDLVSFATSTYMRGLPFITIPTTLIGQIDASTAGKTCLNTKESKNVLGTFYYPIISYNNIHFLKTNTKYHLRQGYSEVFKYGLLSSEKLISLLEKYGQLPPNDILMNIIKLSIETRVKIRKKHPLVSNLGHTFGHAIEKMSDFRILHGDAISAGTVVALNFAEKKGLITKEEVLKIINLMKKIGLNICIEKNINIDKWVELMMRDKKSSAHGMDLVLISGIEKPYEKDGKIFYATTPDAVKAFLEGFMKNYDYIISDCAAFLKKDKLVYINK